MSDWLAPFQAVVRLLEAAHCFDHLGPIARKLKATVSFATRDEEYLLLKDAETHFLPRVVNQPPRDLSKAQRKELSKLLRATSPATERLRELAAWRKKRKRIAKRLAPHVDRVHYRIASELIDDRFPTLKSIRKALNDIPAIRRKRPIGKNGKPVKNRLLIHTGDWDAFKQRYRPADVLDAQAETVEAVLQMEKRKKEIREQNQNRGK